MSPCVSNIQIHHTKPIIWSYGQFKMFMRAAFSHRQWKGRRELLFAHVRRYVASQFKYTRPKANIGLWDPTGIWLFSLQMKVHYFDGFHQLDSIFCPHSLYKSQQSEWRLTFRESFGNYSRSSFLTDETSPLSLTALSLSTLILLFPCVKHIK